MSFLGLTTNARFLFYYRLIHPSAPVDAGLADNPLVRRAWR